MPANLKLRKDVAVEVVGWLYKWSKGLGVYSAYRSKDDYKLGNCKPAHKSKYYGANKPDLMDTNLISDTPDYETDIAAAWTVLKKATDTRVLFPVIHEYGIQHYCRIWVNDGKGVYGWLEDQYGTSAPEAICKAVLNAYRSQLFKQALT